jgi:FkbM family methyltransferase
VAGKSGTWARSLLSPKARLLPGLGERLGTHPRLAAAVFVVLRRLPGARLRAAAYRHVSLPLVQRMDAELEVPVADGFRMLADPPSVMGRSLATSGVWEWYVTAAFSSLLSPGDVFVDVGANVGYYTKLASRLVGQTGHVYALEPGPDSLARLRRNLALDAVSNVTMLGIAAGAHAGRATLFGPASGHDGTSSLRELPQPSAPSVATEVQVSPLHSLFEPAMLDRVSLVKVDVEGYEAEVLQGLEPVFEAGRRPTLLVEIHPSLDPDAPAYVADFCTRHSLRVRWIVDDEGLDYRLAPQDRPLEIRDLESPSEIVSIPRDRYVLILEA